MDVSKENTHTQGGNSHKHDSHPPNRGRVHDRRSGTGRNDNQKRSGKGSYNWGQDTEVYDDDVDYEEPDVEPST
eukprot:CAMPEP_0113933530 /NCGR_PEP_ID=MMETSP1339-20121228/582_1 /TAXON_ID=94617 /ORGANISM="Fibrocapsa japonica" /LENGTH=73 /DNA_ID=CAMNT_0000934821 /DNA_START=81 /DNA_END=302 /DNA_ORIENTATION=+ /assembly_acc=CAM_ASM_000762